MSNELRIGVIQGVILLVLSSAISLVQGGLKDNTGRDIKIEVLLTKLDSIEKTVSNINQEQKQASDKAYQQQIEIATLWANFEQLKNKSAPDG